MAVIFVSCTQTIFLYELRNVILEGIMNINSVLTEYDSMFGNTSLTEIEAYLYQKISEAVGEGDDAAIITLLNEMIGLCRDTSQKEKALAYCEQLKKLMLRMNLEGTMNYATSMQNIANAYRAFGLWDAAEEAFKAIESTYEKNLDKGDYLWASMYNNWGLLYQEKQEYGKSVEALQKALALITQIPNNMIKEAITKTNLANSYFGLQTDEDVKKGYNYLAEALDIFVKDGERDFHYGAALVAMGDYYAYNNHWKKAKSYYQKGLVEILIHTGKTEFYNRVVEKYENVISKIKTSDKWRNNLEKSRDFYEQYGKAMIHNRFPEYEARIAVGMAGEGSDCFGFDDEISTDHDYAVGFCMWLTKEDMAAIGRKLQEAYNNLVLEHNVFKPEMAHLSNRRGVFEIDEFYRNDAEEYQLAEMVNGEIFRDESGIFTARRNEILKYYPEELWRKKLANYLHEFSQYGQANYARMMAREDYLTAGLCISKAIESAMDIAYVLSKEYAPYYKWKRKGLEKSGKMQEILWICEELALIPCQQKAWEGKQYSSLQINTEDKCIVLLETLARIILEKLKAKKLVKGTDVFLENYIGQILEGDKALVDKIVELEWKQFDKVKNEGGRASCQDDFGTFSIMRKSQYLTWNEELLSSYYNDLLQAEQTGWNLIMEKYARMMKSTTPEKYAELEKELPVRSQDREVITEEIVKIQVAWMEEFSKKFPKMAGNARSIHTFEDDAFNTSYETYLRGEIGTYGEETFVLYGRFITKLLQEGRNLAYETMNNTAKLYGYESVENAEARI